MPSLLNIGASYDFDLAIDHKLTLAGTFTSNSFTNDLYVVGLEYRFRNIFMIRGGLAYENDIFDDAVSTTFLGGPCAGVTLDIPMGTVMSRLSRARRLLREQLRDTAQSYGIGKIVGGDAS